MDVRSKVFKGKRNHVESQPTQEHPKEDCDKENIEMSLQDGTRYRATQIYDQLPSMMEVKGFLHFSSP